MPFCSSRLPHAARVDVGANIYVFIGANHYVGIAHQSQLKRAGTAVSTYWFVIGCIVQPSLLQEFGMDKMHTGMRLFS